ncbi:MAG TPA: hypothetical protein VEA69_06745 [Tepidisphaeraceae bacterium]|nr:hypothetical protein [Tepidisphaeraceae bacterium]
MFHVPPSILAASDDTGTLIKILFGVGAVVIWAISATASAAKQRAEQARRRQAYGQLPPDVVQPTYGGVPLPTAAGYGGQQPPAYPPPQAYAPPPAYPPAYAPAAYAPPPPPVPQKAGPTKKQRKQQQQQRAAAQKRAAEAAAVTAQQETRAAVVARRDVEAAEEARAAQPRSGGARGGTPAAQIARLARRRDSLRAAFILSEVLSVPKSLRNDSGQML